MSRLASVSPRRPILLRQVRWSAVWCSTLCSGLAAAEETPAPAGEGVVITVKKQKKKPSEQPVATTTLDAAQLQNAGVKELRDLTALEPAIQFQTPGGVSDSSVRIRGVGTASTNPGLESAVGVVIDGVPRARTGVALSELGELERIEVLKGPQGTQFGAHASAGLIQVFTKNPSFHAWGGHLQGTVGAFRNLRLAAALNAPFSRRLALRIEGSAETRGGLYRDQNSREELDDLDRRFARAKLRWKASPQLYFLVSADVTQRDESCCIAVLARPGDTVPTVNALAGARGEHGYASLDAFDRQAVKTRGRVNREDVLDWGVSAQSDLYTGWGQLTTLHAYRSWEAWRSQDFDHSGVDLGYFAPRGLHQSFDVFSEELRLRGEVGALTWLVGGFYAFERTVYDSTYRMGADFPAFFGGPAAFQPSTLAAFTPGDGARGVAEQEGTELALFTHETYRLTERLRATAGLRASFGRKALEYSGQNFNPACDSAVTTGDTAGVGRFCAPFWDTRFQPAGDSHSRTERVLTGTAGLSYELLGGVHAVASYARGYKSGGYQFDRAGFSTPATPNARDLSFPRETIDAYQVGLRAELLDGKLGATLTAFRQRIQGLQLIENTGAYFVVRSLAEAFSTGAELDVAWRPLDGLTLRSGLAYTDATYSSDPGNLSYAGRELEQSPDWVNVSSVTGEAPVAARLKGVVHVDHRYSSAYFTSGFDPVREQSPFSLTNVRLGLRSVDDEWLVDVWVRNVFDTSYYRRVFPATFQAGSFSAFLGEPRTYGLTVRRSF